MFPFRSVQAEVCRRSLRHFVEAVWPIIEPAHKFVPNWHIDILCQELERIAETPNGRMIINIPPGTGKSNLINVIFPTWLWISRPHLRITTTSYTDNATVEGVNCYVVTAVDASGNESSPSNQGCKTIDTIRPNAPTGLTVN